MRDINVGTLPIFSGLDRAGPARLIPDFVREEHPAGTVLFRQGNSLLFPAVSLAIHLLRCSLPPTPALPVAMPSIIPLVICARTYQAKP